MKELDQYLHPHTPQELREELAQCLGGEENVVEVDDPSDPSDPDGSEGDGAEGVPGVPRKRLSAREDERTHPGGQDWSIGRPLQKPSTDDIARGKRLFAGEWKDPAEPAPVKSQPGSRGKQIQNPSNGPNAEVPNIRTGEGPGSPNRRV